MKYSTPRIRTSMSLDRETIELMSEMTSRLEISKSELMRQAIRKLKHDEDKKSRRLSPAEALERLRTTDGISKEAADAWLAEVAAEREAQSYWWEDQ